MDSKHRHELEKNELAKWLSAQYEDWIRPNSSWLGYAVIGGLVVIAVIIGTERVNAWNQNAAWKQYYTALNSFNANEELELLANTTSGIVGVHARLALAQRQLAEGAAHVQLDKREAVALLEKAVDSFQQVQKATNVPLLLQQTGFGLGQCWETLAAARVGSDDLAKAEEEYQKVAERWGESFKGQRAQKQLALLRQPATRMFLELTAARVLEMPLQDELRDEFRRSFSLDDPFMSPGGPIDFSSFGEGFEFTEQESAVEPDEQQPEESESP